MGAGAFGAAGFGAMPDPFAGAPSESGGSTPFGMGGSQQPPPFGAGGIPQQGAGGNPNPFPFPTGTGGDLIGPGGAPPFGTGGVQGVAGAGGGVIDPGTGGATGGGTCCASGDCLCHGPDPTGLTHANGPYTPATFTVPEGTVHYPTDAEAPLAALSICPGFLNTGPEMAPWGPFYASWGIVCLVTNTVATDTPDIRATKLLAAVDALKTQNTTSGSAIFGKLSGRYGTSGYSMGGGGTTIASGKDSTLRSSIGLAPWGGVGTGVTVPTLLLCGSTDTVAPCTMADGVYTQITDPTPKMEMTIPNATHFNWFSPTDAGGGMSGETALAFEKVYLEGDERWKPILKQGRGTIKTNIQ